MESVHSSDRVGIFDRQFTVHSQKKRKPIITLLLAGPDYSSGADGWKRGPPRKAGPAKRRPAGLGGKGGLVSHNRPPPPCFFKSVCFKGTLSCFRIHTSGSVDSKGAYIAQKLCRSRPFSGRGRMRIATWR